MFNLKPSASDRNMQPPSGVAARHSSDAAGEVILPAVAVDGGVGVCCWICLDGGPHEDGGALLRGGCGCRGEAGWAHVACVAKHAVRHKQARNAWNGWEARPTCQQYTRHLARRHAGYNASHTDSHVRADEPGCETRRAMNASYEGRCK